MAWRGGSPIRFESNTVLSVEGQYGATAWICRLCCKQVDFTHHAMNTDGHREHVSERRVFLDKHKHADWVLVQAVNLNGVDDERQ